MTQSQVGESEPRVSPWTLFLIWCRLSLLSFGGGVATLSLIKDEFVERRQWISEEGFLREWSLCQLAPGINLIALAILFGRRLGGGLCVVASVLGLLLPSGAATILATAAYAYFANTHFVIAARSGIVPAVAGIGLATAWGMLFPIAKKHLSDGWVPSFVYAALLIGCFLAEKLAQVSPVFVILGAGALGAIYNLSRPKSEAPLP